MNVMKKMALPSALVTALLMTIGMGNAQAAATNFDFTGSFLMYDGYDPANQISFPGGYGGVLNTGGFSAGDIMDNGNGMAGDPITGAMSLDFVAGTGAATIIAPVTGFFGSDWFANVTSMTRGYTEAGYTPTNPATNWHTTIVFAWGAPAATPCGVVNCGINVAVDFDIQDAGGGNYTLATVGSWMFDGPFITAQPTFSGMLTAVPSPVPVPAAAWLLGSGLLGLVGVARRKAA